MDEYQSNQHQVIDAPWYLVPDAGYNWTSWMLYSAWKVQSRHQEAYNLYATLEHAKEQNLCNVIVLELLVLKPHVLDGLIVGYQHGLVVYLLHHICP